MDNGSGSYNRFLSGDKSVIGDLVAKYSDGLVYFARCIVYDFDTAEDVAADAFATMFVKPREFENEKQFKAYLYKTARSKALDYLRRAKRVTRCDDLESAIAGNAERDVFVRERNRVLYIAMQQLKREYRDALYLVYIDGFSVDEVCTIMQKSAKQVYNLLARAKTSLRKILEKEKIYEEL